MQKEKYTIIIRVLLGLFACMLLTGDAFAEMSNRSFIALCWKGTLKQVNDAIEKGANVNGRHDQWSPLLVAAQSNPDPEVIRVLIKAGADIKAKSKDGSTPLYMAARYNTVSEVTTVLIEAGADVNARNKYDRTPLVSAASFNSNLEVITALIEAGADVNGKCKIGGTTLIYISRGSAPEAITVLIKAGADVNAKGNDGSTPLLIAAKDNVNPEVINTLVEAGADINAINRDGRTPLIMAVLSNTNPEAIITTLLQLGADPKIKDNTDKMAIDYARRNERLKNTDALRKLEEAIS